MTQKAAAKQVKISGPRAGRLYKLLKVLAQGPSIRTALLKRLKVGMRTFYRDMDLLRECGVDIETQQNGYALQESLDDALNRVPFPDPELTFGEVLALMKGRTHSHQKLRRLFDHLTK